MRGSEEGRREVAEIQNAIVFYSRSPSRSYWFLRDAYFRNSSGSSDERPSVSLKLEWIFDGRLRIDYGAGARHIVSFLAAVGSFQRQQMRPGRLWEG